MICRIPLGIVFSVFGRKLELNGVPPERLLASKVDSGPSRGGVATDPCSKIGFGTFFDTFLDAFWMLFRVLESQFLSTFIDMFFPSRAIFFIHCVLYIQRKLLKCIPFRFGVLLMWL